MTFEQYWGYKGWLVPLTITISIISTTKTDIMNSENASTISFCIIINDMVIVVYISNYAMKAMESTIRLYRN